jgi:hypothetical protein
MILYDKVEELEASFFEYKEGLFSISFFAQNPNQVKVDYYDGQGAVKFLSQISNKV